MKNILLVLAALVAACSGSTRIVEIPGEREIVSCATDADCPEGSCDLETGYCVRTEVEERIVERVCENDAACDDGDSQTSDACVDGICHHTAAPVVRCPVVVLRSSGLPDTTAEYPIVAGTVRRVIGQAIVLTSCEEVDIQQIHLHDLVGGDDTAADFFANLRVSGIFDPVEILTDAVGTVYTFSPAEPIRLERESAFLIEYEVDLLQDPTGDLASVNGIAPFAVEVSAVGRESGEIYNPVGDGLQTVWIVPTGEMNVQLDLLSPGPQQLVLGTPGVTFMCVNFWSPQEAARVCGLGFDIEGVPCGLQNLRVYDPDRGLRSAAIASPDPDGRFSFGDESCSLPFQVPLGLQPTLCLMADLTPWNLGGISGANFRIRLREVVAEGLVSRNRIDGDRLHLGADAEFIPSAYFTTYRTKVNVRLAPGSPSGFHSSASGQVVAVIRIENSPNIGNYEALVQRMNLDIGTTLTVCEGAHPMVRVYKDNISAANLLASREYRPDELSNDVIWADAEFLDVVIAAGAFRDFFVTMDTNAMCGSPGSMRSLTVSLTDQVEAEAVRWSDGVSASITWTEGVPLAGNTLVYSF